MKKESPDKPGQGRASVAAALRYQAENDEAPVLLGSGRAEIAKEMRREAWRWAVPIVEERELAEELAQGRVEKEIAPNTYEKVAEVFRNLQSAESKIPAPSDCQVEKLHGADGNSGLNPSGRWVSHGLHRLPKR